ncbi:MAG: heavy-metal-associated domain-containing protein [Bacteriovoracaceae bacterium]|nr:heavy-metal-associated domain-containing protein [Bacteriovoracaceae bacterium]
MKALNFLILSLYLSLSLSLLLSASHGMAATKFELSIPTMTCESCAASITKSLEKIGAISNVDADVKNLKFRFETKPANEMLFTDATIMENVSKIAGYKVTEVKRIMEANLKLNNKKMTK